MKRKNIKCRILTTVIAAAMLITAVPFAAAAASKAEFYNGELYIDGTFVYGVESETTVADFSKGLSDSKMTVKSGKNTASSNQLVATGMTLSSQYSEYAFVVLGDTNGDGRITTADYFGIKRGLLGKYTLSGAYEKAADVDSDETLTASDYLAVKSYFKEEAEIKYVPKEEAEVDPDWVNKGTINFSGSDVSVSGNGVSVNGTTVTITAGGDFKITGRSDSAMITVNSTEKVKLRLAGCDLSNGNGPVIDFASTKKSFITVSDGTVNYLTDGASYSSGGKATVFSESDLEIKGNGALYITGNYKHGIACDGDLSVENGSITIISAKTDGIHVNDSVSVSGGVLTVKSAGSDGIECAGTKNGEKGTISVSGGTINIVKAVGTGIKALGAIAVTGGDIKISEADTAVKTSANFGMNAGNIDITCNGNGIKAIGAVQISGSSLIKIVTHNDGIDGNASVSITGGTIDIDSYDKTIQSDGKVTISGGNLTLTDGVDRLYSSIGDVAVSDAATVNLK